MRGLQQVLPELQGLGARVAGVSADTYAANGAFAEAQGIEFPLLSDWPNSSTIAAFGVGRDNAPTAQRVTFVFDAEGVLQTVIADAPDMNAHVQGALESVRRLVGASPASG